jgi:transposase
MDLGQIGRLMQQSRQKNDMADAEAICEAVTRPTMRFVAIKSANQQAVLMLHRARDLMVRQRTMLINALRAHLAEFGHVAAQGPRKIRELLRDLEDGHLDVPEVGRLALLSLLRQMDVLEEEIDQLHRQIEAWHRTSEVSQRLATIPGVGVLTATALAATVADPAQFRSARQFAAWLGLVPRQNSSGGKDRLGRITKMGDGYLRKLLVVGATAVLREIRDTQTQTADWVQRLLEKKPSRLVSVALANKTARIVWAVMSKQEVYKPA